MNNESLMARLAQFVPPFWPKNLVEAGVVTNLTLEQDTLVISLVLPFVDYQLEASLQRLEAELCQLSGAKQVKWQIRSDVATLAPGNEAQPISGVRNIIAVSSGKGGVGKSTTSVNLALALKALGATVGILDADVYGPSIPMMLGVTDGKPLSDDGKTMTPISAYGIKANSIGFLVGAGDATIWRGPMASKALSQILTETRWGDLDYLIIDLPPGTGDIQLTLAQQIPTTGALVVTTPQNVALADAIKGISMFNKVKVPVLGIIENMSYHTCSQCGHQESLFGEGGGQRVSNQQQVPLLGQLPLVASLGKDMDEGHPTVVAHPEGELAALYLALAARVSLSLYFTSTPVPTRLYTRLV